MDLGDVAEELVQLVAVAAAALVLGGVGLRLLRTMERRSLDHPALSSKAEGRLLMLEEECTSLRRELTELKDRQDFMDRLFLQGPADPRLSPPTLP